jgi:hypothetical protein
MVDRGKDGSMPFEFIPVIPCNVDTASMECLLLGVHGTVSDGAGGTIAIGHADWITSLKLRIHGWGTIGSMSTLALETDYPVPSTQVRVALDVATFLFDLGPFRSCGMGTMQVRGPGVKRSIPVVNGGLMDITVTVVVTKSSDPNVTHEEAKRTFVGHLGF